MPGTSGTSKRRHRLVFKLVVALVAGLILLSAFLNFGFGELQKHFDPSSDPWQQAILKTVHSRLADAGAMERDGIIAEMSEQADLQMRLLAPGDIVGIQLDPDASAQIVESANGDQLLLAPDVVPGSVLSIGPVPVPRENFYVRVIPALFYLGIALLVFWWLRPLLRDLDILTESTRAFAADYRETSPTAPNVSSLKELAENYDDMATRLRSLIEGQRDLTNALSHEVRTPLSRIRFALAVLKGQDDKYPEPELVAIEGDVQEIDHLIATMLNYARLGQQESELYFESVPVAAWLGSVVDKAKLPTCSLELASIPVDATLWLDSRLAALAVSNLIVNACRHAGSTVQISFCSDGQYDSIRVDDDGPGIPPADRHAVLQAFTRLDHSRNRETGGFGLGLAIVARVMALHGGRVAIDDSARLGGASIVLSWSAPNANLDDGE